MSFSQFTVNCQWTVKIFRRGQPWQLAGKARGRPYTRPTFAPKPILDLKHIIRSPGLYEQNCVDRNYAHLSEYPGVILRLRDEKAQNARKLSDLQKHAKQLQREIRDNVTSAERSTEDLRREAKTCSDAIAAESKVIDRLDEEMAALALALPNLSSVYTPHEDKPLLIEEKHNGSAQKRSNISHVDIGNELNIVDFASAATTSGWGWYFLKNEAALLEQALVQFALKTCMDRGWSVMSPPTIVYSHIAGGCGFQPRDTNGEQQIYQIHMPDETKRPIEDQFGLNLAGTAEIPLAGSKAGHNMHHTHLPLKLVAASRCYRAEAGARGVDTKGLYRVHEFTKVEMFAWTLPDETGEPHENFGSQATGHSFADDVFKEMITIQRTILDSLGLDYRVLEMPMHDLGASASRKQDIEAFFPSRRERNGGWGEVTSASICTDYQSRRLATRFTKRDGSLDWPYTVNGTALAVPRILAAILETHWDDKTKTLNVPEALRPYMWGASHVCRRSNK